MRYPVVIHPGLVATAYSVVVPDLPDCLASGDTLEEAMTNAERAAEKWIEAALDAGKAIPAASDIENLRSAHIEFEGRIWALVTIDPAMLDDTSERVNISLPRRVLHRLDAKAQAAGETRSGFIARMALESA